MKITNKKPLVAFFIPIAIGISSSLLAQNIAINNTGAPANPAAMLDVSSSTSGFLPPRMTDAQLNAIAHPVQGLIVMDTTTHCLMLYSGSSWQSIYCACTGAPATPGIISGSNAVCADTTGKIYSISVVFGANSYTWNVPAGASITAGQGTPSITVTFGSTAGNITVTATNNCGTSAARTLPVTINTIPASVTATVNPNPICAGNTLTLTGSATGAISWNWTGPNSFSSVSQSPAITNITTAGAGTYSLRASNVCGSAAPVNTGSVVVNTTPTGVTATASPNPVCPGNSLNLAGSATGATSWSWTGPNSFVSSLQNPSLTASFSASGAYTLTAGNACGTATPVSTTSVTINVPYAPITITNSQSSTIGTYFQQMITVNSSSFSAYENSSLQNIEFTTGPGASGTILQAWIESGASSTSGNTIYWVNLGSATIAGNGTLTIYMNFMPTSAPVTNGYTGYAPQLYGGSNFQGSYGQYDNGATVFSFYDNFAGTSLSGKWNKYTSSASISVNNGLSINPTGGSGGNGIYTASSSFSQPNVIESYASFTATSNGGWAKHGLGIVATSEVSSIINNNDGDFLSLYVSAVAYAETGNAGDISVGNSNSGSQPNWITLNNENDGNYHVWGITLQSSQNSGYKDYANLANNSNSYYYSSGNTGYVCLISDANGGTLTSYWIRVHNYPPNNVMPGVSFGSETCQ